MRRALSPPRVGLVEHDEQQSGRHDAGPKLPCNRRFVIGACPSKCSAWTHSPLSPASSFTTKDSATDTMASRHQLTRNPYLLMRQYSCEREIPSLRAASALFPL